MDKRIWEIPDDFKIKEWQFFKIKTNKQANTILKLFKETPHKIAAFDTETNGLHIINSNPFLFQFGWVDLDTRIGYSCVVDISVQPIMSKQIIKIWNDYVKEAWVYLAHNVKYDLHMKQNIGLPYVYENLSDTMFFIRAAHDAVGVKEGGPPLKLKDYTVRYIDKNAKQYEDKIRKQRSAIAKALNGKLKTRLVKYTLTALDEIFKDKLVDVADALGVQDYEKYLQWLNEDVPEEIRHTVIGRVDGDSIPYSWCDREDVIDYALYDIVYVLEIFFKTLPVVKARGNERLIEIENDLIIPLFEMERIGFAVDKQYLLDSRDRVKEYIRNKRNVLEELSGVRFTVSQSKVLLSVLKTASNYAYTYDSTGDEYLAQFLVDYKRNTMYQTVCSIIETVQELRTLEKWYSTYIIRFVRDLTFTDRLYTTINQVGAISGRVTSDFQQFPRKGIKADDGSELFHPRRLIQVSESPYNVTMYLDYSQIELRFQALYTILVGEPDINLCRAYMPYDCVDETNMPFDYTNPKHLSDWNGEWYYKEDTSKKWTPTDVHGATTKIAFDIDEDDEMYKTYRSEGKRVNFAKNYGATRKQIEKMFPSYDEERINKIDSAYYEAFPGVKAYHTYCYNRAMYYSHTQNLFGIKYYGVSGHKLINLLIQGSAAYYMKIKERQIWEYFKENNIKTRWQMQIHDELSFEKHISEDISIMLDIKRIMEDWADALVPIVTDIELSKTAWADKKGVETLDEAYNYLSS